MGDIVYSFSLRTLTIGTSMEWFNNREVTNFTISNEVTFFWICREKNNKHFHVKGRESFNKKKVLSSIRSFIIGTRYYYDPVFVCKRKLQIKGLVNIRTG